MGNECPVLIKQWLLSGVTSVFCLCNFLKNASVTDDKIRMSSDFGFVMLDIFEITPQDAGIYTCQVTNEIGTMESTATILVQRTHFSTTK